MADLSPSNATNVKFDSNDIDVTSTEQDLIAAVASDTALEVDSLSVTNKHASTTDSIVVKRYIGATGTPIGGNIELTPGATVVIVSKNNVKRLNEGDKITVTGVEASGVLTASADWKEYT